MFRPMRSSSADLLKHYYAPFSIRTSLVSLSLFFVVRRCRFSCAHVLTNHLLPDPQGDIDEPEMASFPRSHASPPPVVPYHSSLESDIAYQGATLHSPFSHDDPSGELGYPMEERRPENVLPPSQRHVQYLTPTYDRLPPQPTVSLWPLPFGTDRCLTRICSTQLMELKIPLDITSSMNKIIPTAPSHHYRSPVVQFHAPTNHSILKIPNMFSIQLPSVILITLPLTNQCLHNRH